MHRVAYGGFAGELDGPGGGPPCLTFSGLDNDAVIAVTRWLLLTGYGRGKRRLAETRGAPPGPSRLFQPPR